mgnify:CR=1 FL=1
MTDIAVVEVQSPWFSKINWTQVVQGIAAIVVIATGGKLDITPEQQLQIVGAIVVFGNLATIIMKTYFTSTVTPQSAPPLVVKGP